MTAKKLGFQFKQFFVEHGGSAMKVGTDSIMLGSWVEPKHALRILDIGTGSGLLAIMMAQKSHQNTHILGVDIEPDAIIQAQSNQQHCPWTSKLSFRHQDISDLSEEKFDLILSNPPYFEDHCQHSSKLFRSPQRQLARQVNSMSYEQLLISVDKLLTREGRFCCVMPYSQGQKLIDLACTFGLYATSIVDVASRKDLPANRRLIDFSRTKKDLISDELYIYQRDRIYSSEYKSLCQAFYLHF